MAGSGACIMHVLEMWPKTRKCTVTTAKDLDEATNGGSTSTDLGGDGTERG